MFFPIFHRLAIMLCHPKCGIECHCSLKFVALNSCLCSSHSYDMTEHKWTVKNNWENRSFPHELCNPHLEKCHSIKCIFDFCSLSFIFFLFQFFFCFKDEFEYRSVSFCISFCQWVYVWISFTTKSYVRGISSYVVVVVGFVLEHNGNSLAVL